MKRGQRLKLEGIDVILGLPWIVKIIFKFKVK